MKHFLLAAALAVLATAGCTRESRSPDSIREHTADATAAAARDGKAVVKGVFEGLSRKGPVNINKAPKEQLLTLPGITAAQADAIIAGRPYDNAGQLMHRRILPKKEYDRIADRIIAK
ncbi:MAG: helix-hairpin-helix domain-containing protein [Acidobacteriaceae bacterium]|nr:helix-hairpin-helix domain-containing protein [Acidobacteriaceae bacterium]